MKLAHRLAWSIALSAMAACGSKADKPKTEPAPAPAPAPADASAPAAKPAATVVSPEQRAAYRKHLRSGRALAKDKKWTDASAAFAAALEAIPMDGRALSEQGWAAFQAGDYATARAANASAVRASTDSSVVAASHYNLGRVAEATGDNATAARHYRESLRLRENKTVTARLASVGSAGYEPWRVDASLIPCTEPQPLAKLCACLQEARAEEDMHAEQFECAQDVDEAKGWGTVTTTHGYMNMYVQLVSKTAAGWAVAAEIQYTFNPGAFGIFEDAGDVDIDERTVGDKAVLWITTSKSRRDSDMGIEEEEWENTELVTLCTHDAKTGATCLAQFVTLEDYGRDVMDFGDDGSPDAGPHDEDFHTKGLPISRKGTLAVTLGADGIAKVTLASGQKTPRLAPYVGEHKLW